MTRDQAWALVQEKAKSRTVPLGLTGAWIKGTFLRNHLLASEFFSK